MTTQEHRVERIEVLLDVGRYADAEAGVRSELALAPDSAELHFLLARALLCQGQPAPALEHTRIAASLAPESPEVLRLHARVLADTGDGAHAHTVALRALQLAPDDWRSHWTVAFGLVFGVGGRVAIRTAEAAAHRTVTLGPHEPDAHVLYGIVRQRQEDFATAEKAFRNALALDPQHADALYNLASQQIDTISLLAGSETLTGALSAHPQDRGMQHELGRTQGRLLGVQSACVATYTLLFGGLLMVGDDVYGLRIFVGAITVFGAAAHVWKVQRRMPRRSWIRLLPWRSEVGLVPWIAWGVNSLSALVWFTPAAVAFPAWCALAVCSTALFLFLLLALLIGDSHAARDV